MERMKIEIEKSEYDRLKSREEKLMAYYEWFVDKENDLVTVEDIVNKNTDLEEENKRLEEENKKLKEDIKKWEDRRMLRLAEIHNMPTKYLTTAIAKNEWYSSWYDTVKRKMLHDLGFDRLDVQDLLKENKKLKKENEELKKENEELQEYKRMYEGLG